MQPLFCFIDDSDFELSVFEKCIAASNPGIDFIQTTTYERARVEIGDRHPALFILDLYGRDPDMDPLGIPSKEAMAEKIKGMVSVESLYEGLEDFSGDKTNEFLKRMFHMMDSWRQLFARVFETTGQNIKYGLNNLAEARQEFPFTPTVAYTRKSMISDAVEAIGHGFDNLNLKPDGPDDEAIYRETALKAPQLVDSWSDLVTRKFSGHIQQLGVLLGKSGLEDDVRKLMEGTPLSKKAREVLGPGDVLFIDAANGWRAYSGQEFFI
ncbi:MAG: hypothetical protein JRD68_10135 [Deltaproteobacteria bacterium]|nr:hypothetical protein [Deltaproteobacteria bacterium]